MVMTKEEKADYQREYRLRNKERDREFIKA